MPPVAMVRLKKHRRLRRMGGLSSRSSPTLASLLDGAVLTGPCLDGPRGLRTARGSTLPATIRRIATAKVSPAANRKAPCQPHRAAAASTMAGVTPKPRQPPDAVTDKALPIFFPTIPAE